MAQTWLVAKFGDASLLTRLDSKQKLDEKYTEVEWKTREYTVRGTVGVIQSTIQGSKSNSFLIDILAGHVAQGEP